MTRLTLNPFKKHDVSEFPGVLVPLEQGGPRHGGAGTSISSKTETAADSASEGEGEATLCGVLTVESLREDVEKDVVASGVDSAYDRTWDLFFFLISLVLWWI